MATFGEKKGYGAVPAPGSEDPRPPHLIRGRSEGRGAGGHRPLRLTARGGILGIAVVCFFTALADRGMDHAVISGAGFVLACVFTVWFVRGGDLLQLTVSPPMAYFVGALGAEFATAAGTGGVFGAVMLGMGARLADTAAWLFSGSALVLILAVFRGLPQRIQEFAEEPRGGGEKE